MAKYSNEFKLEVVKYCEEKHHGYLEASKFFNIPSASCVRKWVRRYREHGVEGLLKNKKILIMPLLFYIILTN